MKGMVWLAGLLLLAPSAFARDPDPLVTNPKRLAAARDTLQGLPRNSASWRRIRPLLQTLVEEDPKNASRYLALSRRKCDLDEATSPQREEALTADVALDTLRGVRAQVEALLAQLGGGGAEPPVPESTLWTMLAWARRELGEIQGSRAGQ
jgi:hypothetical protein